MAGEPERAAWRLTGKVVTPQLKGRATILESCMLLMTVPAVSFVMILELALVDRGAYWPGGPPVARLAAMGRPGCQTGGRMVRTGSMRPRPRMARAVAGRSVVSMVIRDSVPGWRAVSRARPCPAAAGPAAGRTWECLVFEISSRWLSNPGGCVR